MRKKKIIIFVMIVFIGAALILMGYYIRLDRFGLAQISWVDCVQMNDIKYYSDYERTPLDASLLGERIGEVRFSVQEKVHNPGYRFRNGDATYLEVGTVIYSVTSNSNAIAVEVDDQYYIYTSDLFHSLSTGSSPDLKDFYGTYTFDELIYLTAFSSSTLDYASEAMEDTKYTIEADVFKVEGKDINVELSSPSYVKGEVQFDPEPLFDDQIKQEYGLKYQYDIKDKDGNKTEWRLYVSSGDLFVASYHTSPNGSEIIWEIAKLSQ